MTKNVDNYKLLAEYVFKMLKHDFGKYMNKVGEHTYSLMRGKDERYSFGEIDPKLLVTLKEFTDDLVKHLASDTPLVLLMDKDANFDEYQRKRIFEGLLAPFHYKKYKFSFVVEPHDFKKLLTLFIDVAFNLSISSFFPSTTNCSFYANPYHYEFTKEILSLDFKRNLNSSSELYWAIDGDIRALKTYYENTNNTAIKEGLINYLVNKKELLKQYQNKTDEAELLTKLKNVLHSDHWADVALCLPIYSKSRAKKSGDSSIFSLGTNPVYYINLNKDNLFNCSLATVTDDDMFEMMNLIRLAINATKPEGMDNIDLSQAKLPDDRNDTRWVDPKIYLSGANVNEAMVLKFGFLLEKMIGQYNGPNVDKDRSYDSGENRKKSNIDYLTKMAEVYWLDLELDNAQGKKKKISKV